MRALMVKSVEGDHHDLGTAMQKARYIGHRAWLLDLSYCVQIFINNVELKCLEASTHLA